MKECFSDNELFLKMYEEGLRLRDGWSIKELDIELDKPMINCKPYGFPNTPITYPSVRE